MNRVVTFAAVAALSFASVPAFAHGGGMGGGSMGGGSMGGGSMGGDGMGHGMGQITSPNQSGNSQSSKMTGLHRTVRHSRVDKTRTGGNRLTRNRNLVGNEVDRLLARYAADLKNGNSKAITAITKQLVVLSEQAAKDGMNITVKLDNITLTIGKSVNGTVIIHRLSST
jgi:hypothetical protein